MDDISKYHSNTPDREKRLYLIINHTKKTYQLGHRLGNGGKEITLARIWWLVDDCKKFGYKKI